MTKDAAMDETLMPGSGDGPGAEGADEAELIGGRYEIVKAIGEGAMGQVYLGRHKLMRKNVAIKLLHAELTTRDEIMQRFRREAQATSHLDHPNICATSDFGQTEDGSFYLVMEHLDGRTLDDAISEDGPFDAARAIHVAAQIAEALAATHATGIIHRDLKPENIFLVERGGDPDFVKIVDFGIAHVYLDGQTDGAKLTQAGAVYGTPSYMSPQQAQGMTVDHRADLYALGVIMFEMLTGKAPFGGDDKTHIEIMMAHLSMPVPDLAEVYPSIRLPHNLESMVKKLLEKEPDQRYSSAEAFIKALEQNGFYGVGATSSTTVPALNLTPGDDNGLIGGRYEVIKKLGEGAMGTVHLAQHKMIRKDVAIKVLRPELTSREEILQRFIREAQATANINHPNVCATSDFGQTPDGSFYLVMELLDGWTLHDALEKEGPFSAERAVHVAAQIAAALAVTHAMTIVHRDLKPENIFLVEQMGDRDFVKIVDFGIAHVYLDEQTEGAKLTHAGTVYGTPRYMSPEQAEGKRVDHRGDLYTLGIILYEMLAGQPPFADEEAGMIQLMMKHVNEPPSPIKEVNPKAKLPPGLEPLVMRLLAKKPEQRYESAEALLADIQRLGLIQATVSNPTLSRLSVVKQAVPSPSGPSSSTSTGDSPIDKIRPHVEKALAWTKLRALEIQTWFKSLPQKQQIAVAAGVGVLSLILLILIFSGGGDDPPKEGSSSAESAATSTDDSETNNASKEDTTTPTDNPLADLADTGVTGPKKPKIQAGIKALIESNPLLAGPWGEVNSKSKSKRKKALPQLLSTLEKYDDNIYFQAMMIRAHANGGSDKDAVRTLKKVVEMNPLALEDDVVLGEIMKLFGRRQDNLAKDARAFVKANINDAIAERLILMSLIDPQANARERARAVLQETERDKGLGKWFELATFVSSKQCRGKREHKEAVATTILKLGELGDKQALPFLEYLNTTPKNGCETGDFFKKRVDCWKCARAALTEALPKLKK